MKHRISMLLIASLFGVVAVFFAVNAQAAPADTEAVAAPAAPAEEQVPEEVKAALEDFKATKFEDATKKLEEARTKNPDMAPPQLILAQWFGLIRQPKPLRQN